MEVGEIYIQTEEGRAVLDVKNDKAQTVSLIVQDKAGKPCYEQQWALELGKQSLQFPIADLKAGTYFVWLHYADKTKMSSFKITASPGTKLETKKNPLLSSKFFSW
ncbi:hypothetical protein [Haliscomenobacter sp.]|uniref:hypothetical protein n=1 Tax=Haliscomenobacter sp. TaxID=2717303 RepID=UPI003593A9BF